MRKTLKLVHPLLVNGQELTELDYDAEEIDAVQYSIACQRSAAISKSNQSVTIKFKRKR